MSKGRIGILTGGGDCPGLNAVIRGVTKSAITEYGLDVVGFKDGFLGLIEKRFEILDYEKVSGILTMGGTILGTSNKADPFAHILDCAGEPVDCSDQCMELYNDLGLDALICLGGDGTMSIGGKFTEKGANVIGVPKTIDNDVMETDITFGFNSAYTMATEAVDRLHSTADAHHRVMIVEVMGRNAGWLALHAGIAGGADIIVIPEIPYDLEEICRVIRKRHHYGKKFSIMVVSEGAKPVGGEQAYQNTIDPNGGKRRLGGCGQILADEIQAKMGVDCRVAVLGHLQRGGSPTPFDRVLATRFAVKAMDMFAERQFNSIVALQGRDMVAVPIEKITNKQKLVPLGDPLIKVAEEVGTSLGAKL